MKKGQDAQTASRIKQTGNKRTKVIERIATWFSEAGIPFNTVCLESFHLMLDAIAQFGPGLRGPSLDELDGPLLHKQVLAINNSIEALKESWASEGCSILAHRECDANGRPMLNLAVHCSEEVGEKNVVHVVTNIDLQLREAKMLMAKTPNIVWTKCAASCVAAHYFAKGCYAGKGKVCRVRCNAVRGHRSSLLPFSVQLNVY